MEETITFVGMDTHKATISVAVAEGGRDGEVRFVGKIANTPTAVERLVRKLGKRHERLRFSYEAGPCGYGLQRQLTALGQDCIVAAPSQIARAPGDRVKNDRLDAVTLARVDRAGELTAVWVPDLAHEALRDLVRGREAAMVALKRARQQLLSFLLRQGRLYLGKGHWTLAHQSWLSTLSFEQPAHQILFEEMREAIAEARQRRDRLDQQIKRLAPESPRAPVIAALTAMRGIAELGAATMVSEIGSFRRFAKAPQLMGYVGMTASEDSTGTRIRRGPITKAGNAHVRRVLVEAAWSYRHKPRIGPTLDRRLEALPKAVRDIAWKGQLRLYERFRHLLRHGKPPQVAVTAVARELAGFVWAIACHVEQQLEQPPAQR